MCDESERRRVVTTECVEKCQLDEAVDQFRLLLNDHRRVLGDDHPGTLTTRNNLASWLGGEVPVHQIRRPVLYPLSYGGGSATWPVGRSAS
jgi:hypothetical protein